MARERVRQAERRRELGAAVETIEPGEGADRESAIRIFAARGFDLVIGVGFIFSQDLTDLAREYPEVRFACIDYSPPFAADGTPLPIPENLVGLKFREEEGSFLVGAAAGTSETVIAPWIRSSRSPSSRALASSLR